jgi:hypothetical protein
MQRAAATLTSYLPRSLGGARGGASGAGFGDADEESKRYIALPTFSPAEGRSSSDSFTSQLSATRLIHPAGKRRLRLAPPGIRTARAAAGGCLEGRAYIPRLNGRAYRRIGRNDGGGRKRWAGWNMRARRIWVMWESRHTGWALERAWMGQNGECCSYVCTEHRPLLRNTHRSGFLTGQAGLPC